MPYNNDLWHLVASLPQAQEDGAIGFESSYILQSDKDIPKSLLIIPVMMHQTCIMNHCPPELCLLRYPEGFLYFKIVIVSCPLETSHLSLANRIVCFWS